MMLRNRLTLFAAALLLCAVTELYSGDVKNTSHVSGSEEESYPPADHPNVALARPTKPKLLLDNLDDEEISPNFKCISDGNPKPVIKFYSTGMAEHAVSSADFYDKDVMCCATNSEGQECTQLYDYDLTTDSVKLDEVSNLMISPGETLLLRCRTKIIKNYWEYDDEELCAKTQTLPEMACRSDRRYGIRISYVFIKSVHVEHSGTYTCRSEKDQRKSVNVTVTTESFLSVKMDDQIVINKEGNLMANVSYHHVLEGCYWEDPDNKTHTCWREQRVTKHRHVKLLEAIKSGVYTLHLESGGKRLTRNTSVCIADKPSFKFWNENKSFTCETVTPLPANFTWKSCNISSENNSPCKVIKEEYQPGSDDFCNKAVTSFVDQDKELGRSLIFCVTNALGSWCEKANIFYDKTIIQYVKDAQSDNNTMLLLKVGSLLLILAVGVLIVVLMYYVKKKKPQYQPQLQMIQMVGPNDNDYIYINFKDFDYDKKWEFPRENLELGNELGSGAFGMVVQATAYGINKPGVSQQVAVKMLKEKHQTVEKEALMSELKMLTHIGHHPNIVNLLGACTEKGPIYLIFQYCCYADLLNYLRKNSDRYHKCVTDAFNKDCFRNLYHNLQSQKNSSEQKAPVELYVPMHSSTTRGQEDIALLTLKSDDVEGYEVPEIVQIGDDQTEELQALTFDDLLSFAYQVAKGMDFLSSKNCVHRDLAARNVLVTNGRMVKIGDFGLARDIDNDSNYVVRGNVRLPVKWMAPECIFNGMYTLKSDVWAYGILLWEIFSLGVTPYPGMKVDHTFYSMIETGFKMECPYYATDAVYSAMCKCWALNPSDRPSFSKLVSFMCDQLTEREEKLYHNIVDEISSEYQNMSDISEISALEKQCENKTSTTNEYCKANRTEKSNASNPEEEDLLKPSDTK